MGSVEGCGQTKPKNAIEPANLNRDLDGRIPLILETQGARLAVLLLLHRPCQ